jgi:hypothetical protein
MHRAVGRGDAGKKLSARLAWSLRPEARYWKLIVRNLAAANRPIPDEVPPPPLSAGAELLCSAFADLSACRAVGFGFGVDASPRTAIAAFANRHGLSRRDPLTTHDFDLFCRQLRGLDGDWLEAVISPSS